MKKNLSLVNKSINELEDKESTDLTQQLLEASVVSSNVLKKLPYATKENLAAAKLCLGFLNAHLKAYGLKIQVHKLLNVPEKINAVKKYYRRK
jgi:hypothetical protein